MNWDLIDKNNRLWFIIHISIVIATEILMRVEDYEGWGLFWCWATFITNGIAAGIRILQIFRTLESNGVSENDKG